MRIAGQGSTLQALGLDSRVDVPRHVLLWGPILETPRP